MKPKLVVLAPALLGIACASKVSAPRTEAEDLSQLTLLPAQVSVPQGLTVPVALRIVRTGTSGDSVAVSVSGLPAGVSASPLSFAGNSGMLSLSASPSAPLASAVVATVTVTAGRSSISARLTVEVTATRFSLSLGSGDVSVSRGSSRPVAVRVNRENFSGAIQVTVSGLPPGVDCDPVTIDANLGHLVFRAAVRADVGAFALNVTGRSGDLFAEVPLGLTIRPPGAVDEDFGPGGGIRGLVQTFLQTTDAGTASTANAVALQPDGKIVVAGIRDRPASAPGCTLVGCRGVAVVRYNPDGTLDPTFNGSGATDGGVAAPAGAVILLDTSLLSNPPTASAVSSTDAGILVAISGTQLNPDTLLRLTPDGVFDPTFDPDGGRPGRAQKTIKASSILLPGDEKILVAGTTYSPVSFALARYNPDGTLDETFGDGGILAKRLAGASANPTATSAALVGDKAFIVGSVNFGVPSRQGVALVSFDLSDGGSVNTSFNDGGEALLQLGAYSSNGKAVLPLGENIVVIANTRATSANWTDVAAIKLQLDGGVDPSFGTAGIARTLFPRDAQMVNSATINAAAVSGTKIVLAGQFQPRASGGSKFLVVRYNLDGSPDTAFGTDGSGIAIDAPASDRSGFNAIAFQVDGKMVAVGFVNQGPTNQPLAVVRYLP